MENKSSQNEYQNATSTARTRDEQEPGTARKKVGPKMRMADKLNPITNPKHNPMLDSEYPYYQTFGRVLIGLAKALELRQGVLDDVSNRDILDYTEDVERSEFDFLFGSAAGVIECAKIEIANIFQDAEDLMKDLPQELRIRSIFLRLRKNSPLVTIFRVIGDHAVWRNSLRSLFMRMGRNLPDEDSSVFEFVYANFCCQFAAIMEQWEVADFAEERIPDCISLLMSWAELDAMFEEGNALLLESWRE